MKYEPHPTSKVASLFRENYTVFQLERMQRVSGQAFAISGDAPLRAKYRQLDRRETIQRLHRDYGTPIVANSGDGWVREY